MRPGEMKTLKPIDLVLQRNFLGKQSFKIIYRRPKTNKKFADSTQTTTFFEILGSTDSVFYTISVIKGVTISDAHIFHWSDVHTPSQGF